MADKELELAIGVALMADQLLRGTVQATISGTAVMEAVRQRLTPVYGLGGLSRAKQLHQALIESGGPGAPVLMRLCKATVYRMAGGLKKRGPIRNPVQNLTLAYSVFRGMPELEAAIENVCKASDSPDVEAKSTEAKKEGKRQFKRLPLKAEFIAKVNELSADNRKHLQDKARAWLLALKRRYPDLRRREFRLNISKTELHNYLRWVDKFWLEQQLPRATSTALERLSGYRETARKLRVEQVAAHIFKTHQHAISKFPLKRITKTYLLNGFKRGALTSIDSEEVQRALEACIDTDETKLRRAMYVTCKEVLLRWPEHPLGDELTYENLSLRELESRVRKARCLIYESKR